MRKSNRSVGNAFEQELCNLLFEKGYWSHNFKQDNSGQPADVIAVRNGVAYLIDCKDCSSKGFDLRRVEDNQISAMDFWKDCGNGQGWFAIKIDGEIWMMPNSHIRSFMNCKHSISVQDIRETAIPFERWV